MSYTFLTTGNIVDYVRQNPAVSGRIDVNQLTRIEEVGDGNLNLVFIIEDAAGNGICLKQALPYVRMSGAGWPMTPERARRESDALLAHRRLVPELVPQLYSHDPVRHIIAMQNLSDHQVWRTALNNGHAHPGVAAAVGRYVGAVAFGTSLFGMGREELSEAIARTQNPQLCTITEDLVFTEPLRDAGRNQVLPANAPDAAELAADNLMQQAMAQAKYLFMTHAEALIHGDLHTGSVMVKDGSGPPEVKVFDSEFAFYGPVAYDLGALFANYLIAAIRAHFLDEPARHSWCLNLISESWQGFVDEFRSRWPTRIDPRLWDEEFLTELLSRWRSESWLFAAAELSRRMVGAAKTSDIETLPEPAHELAVRAALLSARVMIRECHNDSSPVHLGVIVAQSLSVVAR
jgi:5-methylthioribose kinase